MNNFRTLRLKKEMSCSELAEKINVKEETIRKYERSIRVPSLKVTLRLKKALGCTDDEFLDAYAYHSKEHLIKNYNGRMINKR